MVSLLALNLHFVALKAIHLQNVCFYSDLRYNSNLSFDFFFYLELTVQPSLCYGDEVSCHGANERVDDVPLKDDRVILAREEGHKQCLVTLS